ncbi:MAG: hypothetical protein GY898_33150 [Proteobacteria bacterium]|nr:hypothetical protein [Pseudomonadota bacterium]
MTRFARSPLAAALLLLPSLALAEAPASVAGIALGGCDGIEQIPSEYAEDGMCQAEDSSAFICEEAGDGRIACWMDEADLGHGVDAWLTTTEDGPYGTYVIYGQAWTDAARTNGAHFCCSYAVEDRVSRGYAFEPDPHGNFVDILYIDGSANDDVIEAVDHAGNDLTYPIDSTGSSFHNLRLDVDALAGDDDLYGSDEKSDEFFEILRGGDDRDTIDAG